MRSVTSQKRLRRLLAALGLAALLLFWLGGLALIAHADGPLDIAGYQGHTYPDSQNNPSGEKPESKLWWHDGFWWGSLWSNSGGAYHIHRYDWGNKTWLDSGVAIDNRQDTRADALWDAAAGKLYIVSHLHIQNSSAVTDDENKGRLYRYSYDEVAQRYSLDSGFPTIVNNDKTETLVVDKDTSDKLWVTYVSRPKNSDDYQVYLNASANDGLTWGTPFTLPVVGSGSFLISSTHVAQDDISALVAFRDDSGDKIGVMWSNQKLSPPTINFAYHVDGAPDDQWTIEASIIAPHMGDDHFNLKSLNTISSSKLFAAVKLGASAQNDPLIGLVVRAETGTFSFHEYSTVADNDTRPIVLVDEGNLADLNDDRVYVFVTGKPGGSKICYKSSLVSSINFLPTGDCGTAFIEDDGATSPTLNAIDHATSTKQNMNETTGMVVLATHQRIISPTLSERYYVFNDMGDPPPVITARGPERDASNVQVSAVVTATFSKPMDEATLNTANFIVEDSAGPVTGSISYDSASCTATFSPNALLKAETTYTVSLIAGVEDSSNQALFGAPEVWSFTTEPAKVQFSQATYSVNEGAGAATITLTLNTASSQVITVPYATADGSAVAGSDYTAVSGALTFNPGQTSQSFAVTIADDPNDEPNETVSLTLSPPANATLNARSSAVLTIIDDDGPPMVQFNLITLDVAENSAPTAIEVTVSPASALTVEVDYVALDGTATAGSDYTAIPTTTLTFAPNDTGQIFTVAINDDNLDEPAETLLLKLANPVNAVLDTPGDVATLTIVDDDPSPTVQFSTSTYTVSEAAGAATVTATLSAVSGFTVTVNYATGDDTAKDGSDYTGLSGVLTFAPGQTSQTFTMPVLEDSLDEGIETVNLTLSNPNNVLLGALRTAVLRIDDNDPLPMVQFSAPAFSVDESAGLAIISVNLNTPSGRPVSIDYTTGDGTATAGSDYTAVSGRVDIPALQAGQTFTVPILSDLIDEASETILLTLSNPSDADLGLQDSAILTIQDDDAPPAVQFSAANFDVGESDGSAAVTVILSQPSEQTVTVNYTTSDETATAGADYIAASGILTFNPGQTSQTFSLSILADTLVEPNETVALRLTTPTNATLAALANATLTIQDDDEDRKIYLPIVLRNS